MRTNWDGTPLDVAEIRARKHYGDACSIEVGSQRNGTVSIQTVGPLGGLSPMTTLTPDNARKMAGALVHYANLTDEPHAARPAVAEGQGA